MNTVLTSPEQARQLRFLTTPRLWVHWPFLPLVRRRQGQEPELGVLCDLLHLAGFGGWMRRAATLPERALAVAGGVLLCYPSGVTDAVGLAVTASALALHVWRTRGAR